MRTHSPENERIKRAYFIYLKEARRLSEHSIDAAAAALSRFEEYTKYRDFKRFHIQQAVGFKRKLADQVSQRTGERLSSSTLFATLNALRAFFHWLAGQPGYRSHLTYADADYFALSEKESQDRKGNVSNGRCPTLEQILHVVRTMPSATDIELRNRALIAFTLLTGARDGAIASLKLKHVDVAEGRLVQDAREVRTKFSKTITTWFFPVGDEIRQIVADWVEFLRKEKLFGPSDPLFPATQVVVERGQVLPGRRPVAVGLVERDADQEDLQGGVHRRRPGLCQSAFVSQDAGAAWRAAVPYARGVQGLEPEPRPRAGADHLLKLWPGGTHRQAELIRGWSGAADNEPLNGEVIDQMMRLLENARHRPT